jgi:hypothetical protein
MYPTGRGCPRPRAARMTSRPRRKQLSERAGRCPVARLRAICCSGSWLTWGRGGAISAWQPTLTVHKVATAKASQSRSARAGASILVCSQCQPPRLLSLKPHSIQARNAYHATSTVVGGRSVRIHQGSRYPASQREQGARELPRGGGKAGHGARPPLPHAADHLGQPPKGGGGGHTIVALAIDP